MFRKYKILILFILLMVLLGSCGGIKPTVFVHENYNFSYIEKVAVVPFENLSKEQGAAFKVTRLFLTELLSSDAFEIVEPGEVNRVINKIGVTRPAELTKDEIITLGKELGVQSIFLGTVNESSTVRSGTSNVNVVTMVVRMVETETGTTVWSAAHTESGKSFWSSVFGTSEKSQSEVARKCVKNILRTIVN